MSTTPETPETHLLSDTARGLAERVCAKFGRMDGERLALDSLREYEARVTTYTERERKTPGLWSEDLARSLSGWELWLRVHAILSV